MTLTVARAKISGLRRTKLLTVMITGFVFPIPHVTMTEACAVRQHWRHFVVRAVALGCADRGLPKPRRETPAHCPRATSFMTWLLGETGECRRDLERGPGAFQPPKHPAPSSSPRVDMGMEM